MIVGDDDPEPSPCRPILGVETDPTTGRIEAYVIAEEPAIDYKQFYAKPPFGNTAEAIEDRRNTDDSNNIHLTAPKLSSRRRRYRRSGGRSPETSVQTTSEGSKTLGEGLVRRYPDITKVPTGSTSRLREMLLGDDEVPEVPMLFCELQELQDSVWHERARWVRFEEDVEEGGGRWSKPFVATLAMHALFELRQFLSLGVFQVDVEVKSFNELARLLADAMVNHYNLSPSFRTILFNTLLLKHVHQHEHNHDSIKIGLAEIGKKLSSRKINEQGDESTLHHHHHSAGVLDVIRTPTIHNRDDHAHKPNEHFAKKLVPGTEASATLVGKVSFLNQSVSALIRLTGKTILDDLTEVAVPTRFVFVLLGPHTYGRDFHEIGRAMGTIMSDDIFRDVAYRGRDCSDILTGLDEFLDEITILPPGEWDPTIRIQPPKSVRTQEERKTQALNQIAEDNSGSHCDIQSKDSSLPVGLNRGASAPGVLAEISQNGDPNPGSSVATVQDESDPTLQRTGEFFGGLRADVKRKLPFYRSDFLDACTTQCVAAVFYLFFACLSPIVTFGGLLGIATENHMAAFESILTGAVCGTSYHLFSGQPITVLGSTGPVLIFEKILYSFSKEYGFDYLPLRFWVGMWTASMLMLIVAFDLSALVQLITRFTEECFATLISVIFIFESFIAIFNVYKSNPVKMVNVNYTCWCDQAGANYSDWSQSYVNVSYSWVNATDNWDNCTFLNIDQCSLSRGCQTFGPGCDLQQPVSDVFFFSCLVFFGTCGLSMILKDFRTSPFFPAKVRSIVGDFAVSISIFTMVGLDYFVGLPTPKLRVPQEFAPTRPDRGWIVNPFAIPTWAIFVAPIPAVLLAVLMFMDQQITAVIVNRREHKLTKGKGYHLDLFLLTLHVCFCATFGLPYFVAATVLSITHVNALRKQSETSAPGEQPKFLGLIEQRVTGFIVFALIGCAIPLRSVLKYIPMPVLYGVFLYMGLAALNTSQFYSRCLLIFMPVKYQPDTPYLRHMKTWRVHLFTGIQLTAFIVLLVIKQIKQISILFILMLVAMVLTRKLLDFIFSQEELRLVDDILPKNPLAVSSKNQNKTPNLLGGDDGNQPTTSNAKSTKFEETAILLKERNPKSA